MIPLVTDLRVNENGEGGILNNTVVDNERGDDYVFGDIPDVESEEEVVNVYDVPDDNGSGESVSDAEELSEYGEDTLRVLSDSESLDDASVSNDSMVDADNPTGVLDQERDSSPSPAPAAATTVSDEEFEPTFSGDEMFTDEIDEVVDIPDMQDTNGDVLLTEEEEIDTEPPDAAESEEYNSAREWMDTSFESALDSTFDEDSHSPPPDRPPVRRERPTRNIVPPQVLSYDKLGMPTLRPR